MQIRSVAELVEKIGGLSATARLLKTSPQNVLNWRGRDKLPSHLMLQQKRILARCGYALPDRMWLRPPVMASARRGGRARKAS